jgi:hypothetical protein
MIKPIALEEIRARLLTAAARRYSLLKPRVPAEQNRIVEIEVVGPGQSFFQSFQGIAVRSLIVRGVS